MGEEHDDFTSEVISRLSGRDKPYSRYKLEGEVARGGQGAIVRVYDEDLQRNLAMKVVLGRTESSADTPHVDSKTLGRFLEEAQVTAQLDHPGIVPVHELGLDPSGQVYFTMKLVKGEELRSIFEKVRDGREGWTITRALNVLLKVCEAMAYAHSKGVIHRDLKPGNIMVGRFGEVYVMDWGLARVLDQEDRKDVRIRPPEATSGVHSDRKAGAPADSSLITMDGDVVGTPAYMSPEQARGDLGAMGPQADVFAVGAMLYHLFAGHGPYMPPRARLSNYAIWYQVQKGPPDPIDKIAPETPPELVAICEKAMSRDPSDRYQDMGELAADLAAFIEHRVVTAYATGAWEEARKWVARNKPLAAALAAAVVLLVVGLTVALYLRGEAIQRADDVLRLSALQDMEDLLAEADGLWPPHPENIEAYKHWIGRAEELVGELPRHHAKRDRLRVLALPRTEEQRIAERESHPEFSRLAALQGEIDARRRSLAQRRDGVAAELPEVDWSEHGVAPLALNAETWPLVDPDRESFGQEPLGLVLAQRALELVGDDAGLRATIGNTVAWAYFALGRDEEALDTSFVALESAGEERRTEFEGYLAKLEEAVAVASDTDAALAKLVDLETDRGGLDALIDERRDWHFPTAHAEARWWDAQLTKLIEGVEKLSSGLLSEDAIPEAHGWSIPKRLAFAERLRTAFAPGGAYAVRWDEALPGIEAAYPDLSLSPQMGLVPIGPDPESGLWEFWHTATGEEPARGTDGKLVLTEEMCVVLVLIPAGTFWMGAQNSDPGGRNYDPRAKPGDGPVHEVGMSAYFLSKYEMTQGQWERCAGENPSYYSAGNRGSPLHPVEQVNWWESVEQLGRLGLTLPSEAQWECGARAGTQTRWWTGQEESTLEGSANLADESFRNAGSTRAVVNWSDGYPVHAPAGSLSPNPYGLHHVAGNVWEWCLDWYHGDFYTQSPEVDPVPPHEVGSPASLGPLPSRATNRVFRGGGFSRPGQWARSAARFDLAPSTAISFLGLRPARPVTE